MTRLNDFVDHFLANWHEPIFLAGALLVSKIFL